MRSRHRHPHDARWLDDLEADSDPERELAETRLKFRPIVEAFG